MIARIISWMGSDLALQNKRVEYHRRQVEWLLDVGITEIVIVAQEYKPDWYIDDPRIRYINVPNAIGASSARNLLLNDFYDGSDEWSFFADNDCILSDRQNGRTIFCQLDKITDENIYIVMPMNGRNAGDNYNFLWSEFPDTYNNSLSFTKLWDLSTGLWFFRRPKTKLYFDCSCTVMEDGAFALEAIRNGMGVFKCENILIRDLSGANNSTLFKSNKDRIEKMVHAKKWLANKFPGLTLNDKGHLSRREFAKTHWTWPTKYLVPT